MCVYGDANGGECIGLNTNAPLSLLFSPSPQRPEPEWTALGCMKSSGMQKGKGIPEEPKVKMAWLAVSGERMSGRKAVSRIGRMETRSKKKEAKEKGKRMRKEQRLEEKGAKWRKTPEAADHFGASGVSLPVLCALLISQSL